MFKGGLFFLFTYFHVAICIAEVQQYKTHHDTCYLKNQSLPNVTLIRSFYFQNKQMGLIVNPETLQTRIIEIKNLDCSRPISANRDNRYEALIEHASSAPFPLENDGLTTDTDTRSVYLTVDLCPSHKTFNADLKRFLISSSEALNAPLPVAFSVSGGWIKEHSEELSELKQLQKQGIINITWVNHTRHHYYDKTLDNEHNFLLLKNVDPLSEILEQEKLMIEQGLTPSIFMRFPGLISNEQTINLIKSLSLIPIGAKSWIAKTKKFNSGDIVLIHGNGNEPIGVSYFLNLVSQIVKDVPWQSLENWGTTE